MRLLHPIALPLGISFYTFHGDRLTSSTSIAGRPGRARPLQLRALHPLLPASGRRAHRPVPATSCRSSLAPSAGPSRGCTSGLRAVPARAMAKKVVDRQRLADRRRRSRRSPSRRFGFEGLACACSRYTFQIYVDFSGYSDMAIGIGALSAFEFPQNFDCPYIVGRHRRVLAALAHHPVDAGSAITSTSRSAATARRPARPTSTARHDAPRRPLARRELDVRHLGPHPRRVPGDRTSTGSCARSTPPGLRSVTSSGRRPRHLGVLPRAEPDVRPHLLARDGGPRRRGRHRVPRARLPGRRRLV